MLHTAEMKRVGKYTIWIVIYRATSYNATDEMSGTIIMYMYDNY